MDRGSRFMYVEMMGGDMEFCRYLFVPPTKGLIYFIELRYNWERNAGEWTEKRGL